MEGESVSQEWEVKVRVYPTIPAQEVCIIKFMRTSLPKNMNAIIQKWNFQTYQWDLVKPLEADVLPGPYCLGMPQETIVAFATELLKGALRVEHV
jgi:hypothetical protein